MHPKPKAKVTWQSPSVAKTSQLIVPLCSVVPWKATQTFISGTGRTVGTAETLSIPLHCPLASLKAQSSPRFFHMACNLTETSLMNFNIHKMVTRVMPQHGPLKIISEGGHDFETKWSIEGKKNRMRICNELWRKRQSLQLKHLTATNLACYTL